LAFNARALHEALDPRTPLRDRVKFLAIFSSNHDEFVMQRFGRAALRLPSLRASGRHTCVNSRPGVPRGGHID
jgi:polyphosphate kinase